MKRLKNSRLLLAGSAALAALLVYLPALRNAFVEWDDNVYIFDNPFLKAPALDFIAWAFRTVRTGYWHPLTWISYSIDYAVWGLNPAGYHLTNIVLHALNTGLVFFVAARLLETVAARPGRECPAAFPAGQSVLTAAGTTALLFGLHPVHVESVAWVSERKDLLCALFYLAALIVYLGGARRAGFEGNQEARRMPGTRLLAVAGLLILALLSKPMAVTLPAVLLLLDWHPLNRIASLRALPRLLIEKLPLLAASLVVSLLTLSAQSAEGALQPADVATWSTRLLVAVKAPVAYLAKMILPLHLTPYYPYPEHASLGSPEFLVPAAIELAVIAASLALVRKQKAWLWTWAYYGITLIPVLGIVQAGGQSMADRYTYLPSLGPFLLAGAITAWISEKTRGRDAWIRFSAAAAGTVLLVSLSVMTVRQIGVWKNGIAFWDRVIEREPDRIPLAYNNRGLAYANRGRFDRAIEDFSRAIALNPLYFDAFHNRGLYYSRTGAYDRAIEDFNRSLALNPENRKAYLNRGITYELSGSYDRAIEDFNKTIELESGNGLAYYNRGTVYIRTGDREQAARDMQKACELGLAAGCEAVRRGD